MPKETTWHVDITLTELEGRVSAEARLDSGFASVSGVGYARVPTNRSSTDHEYALAVRRSLRALSGAVEYVIDARTLSTADQA
jgi:hypothetical protein